MHRSVIVTFSLSYLFKNFPKVLKCGKANIGKLMEVFIDQKQIRKLCFNFGNLCSNSFTNELILCICFAKLIYFFKLKKKKFHSIQNYEFVRLRLDFFLINWSDSKKKDLSFC